MIEAGLLTVEYTPTRERALGRMLFDFVIMPATSSARTVVMWVENKARLTMKMTDRLTATTEADVPTALYGMGATRGTTSVVESSVGCVISGTAGPTRERSGFVEVAFTRDVKTARRSNQTHVVECHRGRP